MLSYYTFVLFSVGTAHKEVIVNVVENTEKPLQAIEFEVDASSTPVVGDSELVQPISKCFIESDVEQTTISESFATCDCVENAIVYRTIELALILGGMDTGGEIFDDCMTLQLSG